MKRQIVILANSRKMGNRCIAGIDMRTGEWMRPCFGSGDEGVPWNVRQVEEREPELLEVLAIPLANDGPHRDCQPENHLLLDGPWGKVGRVEASQILKYCDEDELLLHNADKRIHVNNLLKIPAAERKSLCLVRAHVKFFTEGTYKGKKVNASFLYGSHKYCLPVTDYEFERKFPAYSTAEADCIMTISLGSPYDRDNCCYKFVAGVIEL